MSISAMIDKRLDSTSGLSVVDGKIEPEIASCPAQPVSPLLASAAHEPNESDESDTESIGGQKNIMSPKKLRISLAALAVCLFLSFIDQTSVSTATPAIAADLNTGASTSWIGTAPLISSTAFQLINGRLSDIFGRKNLLLICLAFITFGDLACGFSQNAIQLFVLRSIAGIGGGGINSLAMIIVSDITTLSSRGKCQGILGAVIAVANGTGPFIGGAVVELSTWRWVFWMIPIISIPTALVIWFFLPLKHRSGDYAAKIKKVDYGGVVLNLASTLLVLIPLSGGGSTYAWSSPFFISGVSIGILLTILFVLYEWKLAKLPIMPLHLYRAPHCSALYAQTFLIGLAYFGNLFYFPIYFQSVLKYSAVASGAMILPLTVVSAGTSISSGFYMKWKGNYMHCVLTGFILWTLGSGLTLIFKRRTGIGSLMAILIVDGAGMGLVLQPSLVGMYANTRSEDRAVVTGLRNFLRTIGGAFGLVISGVILSNTLNKGLSEITSLSPETRSKLTSSTYTLDDLNITPADKEMILDAYMKGLRYIFTFYLCCSGLGLALTSLIGNTNLEAKESNTSSGIPEGESLKAKLPAEVDIEKGAETVKSICDHG